MANKIKFYRRHLRGENVRHWLVANSLPSRGREWGTGRGRGRERGSKRDDEREEEAEIEVSLGIIRGISKLKLLQSAHPLWGPVQSRPAAVAAAAPIPICRSAICCCCCSALLCSAAIAMTPHNLLSAVATSKK